MSNPLYCGTDCPFFKEDERFSGERKCVFDDFHYLYSLDISPSSPQVHQGDQCRNLLNSDLLANIQSSEKFRQLSEVALSSAY